MIELLEKEKAELIIGDKTYTIESLSMIDLVEVLKFLPLTELAQAVGGAMNGSVDGWVVIAGYLKKDAASLIQAAHKASGIPLEILKRLSISGFEQVVMKIIEVNEKSFKECFFLEKLKAQKTQE